MTCVSRSICCRDAVDTVRKWHFSQVSFIVFSGEGGEGGSGGPMWPLPIMYVGTPSAQDMGPGYLLATSTDI